MFAIIDIEATGGNPKKDRITEVAIFIHNGKRVIEQYCTLINPETYISPFITALTGITNEMVAEAPTFAEVADKIQELTAGKVFVAHNVRFDYSFINNEFKRIGQRYLRKQLCTVRLSRKLIPGLTSYSLGRLCQQVGIPVEHRHRAFGDAAATAELFDLMLKQDKESIINEALKDEINQSILPPHLTRDHLEELPEETGIYYFRDERGKILYIGKSTNIRQRIISHFSGDMNSEKYFGLKNKMRSIDYQLTGNELVALLLESHEIKRWMPEFNSAQRRKKYRYGLYMEENDNGYLQLKMRMLQLHEPLFPVSNPRRGEDILLSLAEDNNLCLKLCGISSSEGACLHHHTGLCAGACIGEETPENYNIKVERAIARYRFENPSFMIVGEGRSPVERSVICVENGQYIGYGFFDGEEEQITDTEQLKAVIQPLPDHPDIHKIIRSFLKKKTKGSRVITY